MIETGALIPRPVFVRIRHQGGFTLIELSIVLVIIGLIIGGILVGQDLISAAAVRAQIAQLDKYNSAVNTFHDKYGGIPGDLNIMLANQFGFNTTNCNGAIGRRDGNGFLDGNVSGYQLQQSNGEVTLFWQDLSTVNLIDGEFPNGGAVSIGCFSTNSLTLAPGIAYLGNWLPKGRIGQGTFLYVYENNGDNWYGLSAATGVGGANVTLTSNPGLSVIQAYNIDKKVDDGLPTTGKVQANYLNGIYTFPVSTAPSAATDSSTTCYSGSGTSYAYSLSASANQGSGFNCALSFRFQ